MLSVDRDISVLCAFVDVQDGGTQHFIKLHELQWFVLPLVGTEATKCHNVLYALSEGGSAYEDLIYDGLYGLGQLVPVLMSERVNLHFHPCEWRL